MSLRKAVSITLLAASTLALTPACAGVMNAWQDASNRDMTNRVAPALQSTVWIHPSKEVPSPDYTGRWTMLAFFDAKSKSTVQHLPEFSAVQDEYAKDGVVVFGITQTDLEMTQIFLEDQPVGFSILTDARTDRVAFGIKNLWDPVVYLVDPYQRVMAEGLGEARELLREEFGH